MEKAYAKLSWSYEGLDAGKGNFSFFYIHVKFKQYLSCLIFPLHLTRPALAIKTFNNNGSILCKFKPFDITKAMKLRNDDVNPSKLTLGTLANL